ncbi:unnamed protein product [Dibothriocephalus latus]|uniref:Protein SERAC1 n=1 Tax=Dibothriocephalus latus TaxID=60516 RepID=A0A3P7NTQ3_DIBLA|nr:unnamed protein product [Dibothriocephalus latus]
MAVWEASNDEVFKLKAAKIRANLETHCYYGGVQRGDGGSPVISPPVILGPHLYKLDNRRRSIDQRARIILRQLLVAGVGHRPIIWISHSAGGILNKEILRISVTHFADWTKNTDPIVPLELQEEISIPFNSFAFGDDCSPDNQSESPNKLVFILPDVKDVAKNTSLIIFLSVPHRGGMDLNHYYLYPMTTQLTPEALDLQKVINSKVRIYQTVLGCIVGRLKTFIPFICMKLVCLDGSLQRFFYMLSPTPDNPAILSLQAWFKIWAFQRPIRIINMVETKKLKFSSLLPGMLIVPYDPRDEEYSEVVQLDADHHTICKPETKTDEIYRRIVALIRDQVDFH